jgi:chromosome segregation ATPase
MDIGFHIPAYLFCEQFIEQKNVLDVFPTDEQGTSLLAKSARSVTVVQPDNLSRTKADEKNIREVIASVDAIPFSKECFDLIFCFASGKLAEPEQIESFLKSARASLDQQGLVALSIPNKECRGFDKKPSGELPSFFNLERSLRRHFPHVTIFGQRPLHGAVLAPFGKKGASGAPLLDDRLLPEGGEAPSHFFALCALRYHKVDDTTIAMLPYNMLADHIGERLQRFEAQLEVTRSESDIRAREANRLEVLVSKTEEKANQAEIIKHEKELVSKRLAETERQVALRDELLTKTEEALEIQSDKVTNFEQHMHEEKRKTRLAEQLVAEIERKYQNAQTEREEAEKEREETFKTLRNLTVENKAKQRELDTAKEEVAGLEVELSTIRGDVARHRRETFEERERASELKTEMAEFQERQLEIGSLQAEIDRQRALYANERERFEKRIAEEHKHLLEEMNAKGTAEDNLSELEKRLGEALNSKESSEKQYQHAQDDLESVRGELGAAEQGQREFRQQNDALERKLQDRTEELGLLQHRIELQSNRTMEAEKRSVELSSQIEKLQNSLHETESQLADSLDTTKNAAVIGQELTIAIEKQTELENNLAARDESMALAIEKQAAIEQRLAHSENNLAASNEKQERLENELLKRTEQLNKALEKQQQIDDSLIGRDERISDGLDKQQELRQQLTEQQKRLDEALNKNNALETSLVRRNENLAETLENEKRSEKTLAKRDRELATALKRQHDLDEKLANRDQKLSEAVEKQRALESEVRTTTKSSDSDSDVVKQLKKELEKVHNSTKSKAKELSESKKKLRQSDKKIADIQAELGDSKTERTAEETAMRRLVEETEKELLKVSGDLEVELRTAKSSLDASNNQIWELRDEVTRLRAHFAATAAANEPDGTPSDLKAMLAEQEVQIAKLTAEKEELEKTAEKQRKHLEIRKRNLNLVAEQLKKERKKKIN